MSNAAYSDLQIRRRKWHKNVYIYRNVCVEGNDIVTFKSLGFPLMTINYKSIHSKQYDSIIYVSMFDKDVVTSYRLGKRVCQDFIIKFKEKSKEDQNQTFN